MQQLRSTAVVLLLHAVVPSVPPTYPTSSSQINPVKVSVHLIAQTSKTNQPHLHACHISLINKHIHVLLKA
jgi:hypothetical protein